MPTKIAPADPSVTAEERPRLSRQCVIILGMFVVRNERSNAELASMSFRYGARIHDLRKAGYDIQLVSRDHVTGTTHYRYYPK